jgi:indole-3-glycerol phosphate synthase
MFDRFLHDFNDILPKTIIDFKAVSPKDGDLFRGRDPVQAAKILEKAGVLGLSVVTEPKDFGGSLELLKKITSAVNLPILRKDFVTCEKYLHETVENGAEGILLICATIPRENLPQFYKKSLELGLKPLVEVHNREEMELAKDLGAEYVGINNKDITILEKDSGTVETTRGLIGHAPEDAFIVSESGILTREDADRALAAGVNAVLIGTGFWNYEGDCT